MKKQYVSYEEAPFVAIKMVEGLRYEAFYDEIKKGQFMLNYSGISLLAGIMGCNVEKIEIDDDDAKELVLKAIAVNPEGHQGYAWISRPKVLYDKDDEDVRERSYTHVKRNALRDLVPYHIFLELLLKAKVTGVVPETPKSVAEIQETTTAQDSAREVAKKQKDNLMTLFGLSIQDCIDHTEECIGEESQWDAVGWRMLEKVLLDPVGMGVKQAVEIAQTREDATGEEVVSEGNDVESDSDDEDTPPVVQETSLESIINGIE